MEKNNVLGKLVVLRNLYEFILDEEYPVVKYLIIGMESNWVERMLPLPSYSENWTKEALDNKGTIVTLEHLIEFYQYTTDKMNGKIK